MNNKNLHVLSIIIPVYNEEATLLSLLRKIQKVYLLQDITKEIIIINDGSTDRTEGIIKDYMGANPFLKIQYFQHATNQGKGAALHTGIGHATGEYLIIQDADLEYEPQEYNLLLAPIISGIADVVYGSRFLRDNRYTTTFFGHAIGNKFLTMTSNIFTGLHLTDLYTGYKLFPTPLIQSLHLKEKHFGFESEVTTKIARIPHIRISEVSISYHGRTYREGKKIGWRDGFRAIVCIFIYSFFSGK